MTSEMRSLRNSIDRIDRMIVSLLHKRAANVKKIALIKKKKRYDIYDPVREALIIKNIKKGEFSSEALEAIFRKILSASRDIQKKLIEKRG